MYTSIFALGAAVVGVIGMSMYAMPTYMGGSIFVAAFAIGLASDKMRANRAAGQ